jgi:hypothetical protein
MVYVYVYNEHVLESIKYAWTDAHKLRSRYTSSVWSAPSTNSFEFVTYKRYIVVTNTETASKVYYPKETMIIQKLNATSFLLRVGTMATTYDYADVAIPTSDTL